MLVCKFEINWSTNKNLRAFTTYLGRTDGRTDARHFHISRSTFRGQGTKTVTDITTWNSERKNTTGENKKLKR
jgi:hypothetical protein